MSEPTSVQAVLDDDSMNSLFVPLLVRLRVQFWPRLAVSLGMGGGAREKTSSTSSVVGQEVKSAPTVWSVYSVVCTSQNPFYTDRKCAARQNSQLWRVLLSPYRWMIIQPALILKWPGILTTKVNWTLKMTLSLRGTVCAKTKVCVLTRWATNVLEQARVLYTVLWTPFLLFSRPFARYYKGSWRQ